MIMRNFGCSPVDPRNAGYTPTVPQPQGHGRQTSGPRTSVHLNDTHICDWHPDPVFNTRTGDVLELDAIQGRLISESKELAIYFTQDLKLGKQIHCAFFDSGSNGTMATIRVIEYCGATCVDYTSQYIIEAGNNVVST